MTRVCYKVVALDENYNLVYLHPRFILKNIFFNMPPREEALVSTI
jgi:hypothetical protein